MEQNNYFIGPKRNWLPAGSRELVLCGLLIGAGLFLANMVIFGGFRLGFAIAGVLALAICGGYLYRADCKGDWYSRAMLVLVMVILAGFGWSDDVFVKLVLILFVLVGGHLALCLMAGQNRYAPGGFRTVFDGVSTIFTKGFGKMGEACRGVVMAFRSGGELTQRSGAVLAGVGIAVPALAVVIPLLMEADAAFQGLVGLLPDFDLFEIVTTAVCGSFCAVYLYSLSVGLGHSERERGSHSEVKRLNKLTMNTALGAVCGVYVVYLFSQLAYFVGGFAGILPEGYTAAQYARRGFFEMAWLCAVNLGLIAFGVGLVRKEGTVPGSTRILCAFIGCVTLFLVAASCAKMTLYIDVYGLTRLRVLTMVIMAFLAVTTVLVGVWLFVPKLPYMKAVMLIALAMGAAVIWADVDTQVAKYNVSAYLNEEIGMIDLYHLSSLGSGAVPYIELLTECGDTDVEARSREILECWYLHEPEDFRSMTYLEQQALEILEAWQAQEAAQ